MNEHRAIDRRGFLAASCAGWLTLLAASPAAAIRRSFASRGYVVAQEPWGHLEQLADGVWAMVSTPLVDHPDARNTLCNGGIIAGRDGVLVVEGFGSDAGATWMAEQAVRLTGRRPTHVVITHYHGDHCNGLHGYAADGVAPRSIATERTRDLIVERSRVPEATRVIPAADIAGDMPIDLGGRVVRITAAQGHTPSDVTLRVEDPPVVFCGDLVWNGMFPNYVDADPPRLATAVRAIGADDGVTYVPGHGTLADAGAMRVYADMLDHVGEAATRAIDAGRDLAEAAGEYRLPAGVADWVLFSPRYFQTAFEAWARSRG
jgi:glyoxylase-like metal-dependent hydrolase (beta-lactamase superfamily II)